MIIVLVLLIRTVSLSHGTRLILLVVIPGIRGFVALVLLFAGCKVRKGANGVGTNGVTANCMFFDRGTLLVLLLTYLSFPKCQGVLFPQSVKIHYFCSGPITPNLPTNWMS